MSKILDYLKLIPAIFENPKQIVEGWINDIKLEKGDLPEDEVEEILRRRAICETCPYMSRNAKQEGWYNSSLNYDHCTFCSCPIPKKTASLTSNCGIEKEIEANPDTSLKLKWEAYK